MNKNFGNKCRCAGFSLVELVLIVAILTTLLGIAALPFAEWRTKYKVESQVRQMVTDFSELRVKAMTTKQRHSITVNANNYVFRSYSSDDEPNTAGTIMPNGVTSVPYALKTGASAFCSGQIYEIDHRGMMVSTVGTIYLDTNSSAAGVDCLTIHTVRINPGKKNATWSNCDDK